MSSYSPRQSAEIFHLCFLNLLGRKTDKAMYALKGGCNLRFYFNSFRYSEDMDIDVQIILPETLTKKVDSILNARPLQFALAAKQLSINEWSKPKQTETTQRWKVQLQSAEQDSPIQTKIEFSRRHVIDNVCFEAISSPECNAYALGPILSNHYSKEAAYQQKISALIGRTQTQARDVFDLYLLLNHGVNPLNDIRNDHEREVALNNLQCIDFDDFKAQVVSYLLPDYQDQYDDIDAWNAIQVQVHQAIEKGQS